MKYQKFTPTGCEYIEIRKIEFVAKTQFLYLIFLNIEYITLN